ncbi:MAG TPA: ABC transporter substrate-binding protein [Candidatus Acetothermia bacterium]|nr:ABC transporter substrate-binding protein [Candidatus Acetothermia bacterium]
MSQKLLLIGALFAMCALPVFSQAIPKDTLVVGLDIGIIVDLEPARVYEDASNLVIWQIYDNLITFNGTFNVLSPGLAESWDASADGLTWTFHLRKGAKFHSGNEVTADAVVFSFTRALALNFAPIWMLKQYVPSSENIKKIDKYTVAITTTVPLSEGLMGAIMGVQGICSIIDPAVVAAHKTASDPWANKWLQFHDAGSGPYKLIEWAPNDRVIMQRFNDYWGGPAKTKNLIFLDIPEVEQQALSLESGSIDIALNLLPSAIEKFKTEKSFKVYEIPGWHIRYLAMNAGMKPFDNPLVREAVKYAIDYNAIVNGIVKGAAVIGETFIPVGIPGHLDATPYHKDIQKAKDLLAQAGYPNGFTTQILCTPTFPGRDIAIEVQQDLAAVGIKADVVQLVAAQMYTLYRAQKQEMIVADWGVDYASGDSLVKPFAHCCSTGPDAPVRQLAWRNMYSNCKLTALVDKTETELNEAKRLDMYKQIQQTILNDGPFAIMYYPLNQYAAKASVKGFVPMNSLSFVKFDGVYKE